MSDYVDGFSQGYSQALKDLFDDECANPEIIEAREWLNKKDSHNANS